MAVRYDRMIYDFYKKDVDRIEEMYDNVFSWLKAFEADALAAIANDDDLFNSKASVVKKRSRKKATEENDLPPAKKKLSIIPEPEQCKRVSIDLVRIDEKSLTPPKPVTPAKPPRRNVSRLASINASQKLCKVFADENVDPSDLRVTLGRDGQPTITSKNGNVPKKVQAYEAKLSSSRVLRNNSINLEPVAIVVNEATPESPPSVDPPLHVSSAVLTLSDDKCNRTYSPRITCSPLNLEQMTRKTSRGTYLLTAQPLFKLPATSMGASRRRSSAMRIKLNAILRKSFSRKSFLKIKRESIVVSDDVEPMDADGNAPVQNGNDTLEDEKATEEDEVAEEDEDAEEDEAAEEDKTQSPNLNYNLRHSRQNENERKSKSSPTEVDDEHDSVISASPSPILLKSQTTSVNTAKGSRTKNNFRTPVLRVSRLQSSTSSSSSVKHLSSTVKSRNNLSCGSGNSSAKSYRIKPTVYTPTEKELKRFEAWKLKEQKTQDILRRRDEMLRKRVAEHKRKLEERLDRATKIRLEKEQEKINKRKEHDEEEARRAEVIARKKREQEEQEKLHRENEARKAEKEQQRLRELETAKERELQAKKEEKLLIAREKAEAKARAKEERRLKEEEQKRIIEEENARKREEELRREEAENIAKVVAASSGLSVVCEKLNETHLIAEKAAHLLNTTVTLNSSTVDGPSSYDMTPQRNPDVQEELQNPDNYNIDDIKDDDSTDDEEKPKKKIPPWAEGRQLRIDAIKQSRSALDINVVFPPKKVMPRLDLSEIFRKKKSRFFHRTSSAVWKSPPLKE